ncbi:TauD/TfdA family dioxygenase [Amycolatopsis saalfeldensis]|uniref:Taurine dioxygenase, alpha-ketoglutarate-dependent n=1 Tax=Amycolatopsis saalfeldensis TaxID=394193 RepID=A0A1H8Y7X5_9PSEU|nr:TauD/TfdA family dioxygenase [Amycolatopsis saalfeldensis]SEP48384.1 Taurine dioxygenase, alpha-ketoglutarate-dependent [Amycolatopsis saalfeldensis]
MSESLPVNADGVAPPTLDLTTLASFTTDRPLGWIRENRARIDAALAEHGALYFAGSGITDRRGFAAVRDALFDSPAHYREKATPRTDFGAGVYSSTDLPPSQDIRQHNENSYTLTFPGKLLFGCLTPPETGGATTVADVRSVLGALPAHIRDRMAESGWRLARTYHESVGLPWPSAFGTDRKSDVEEYCVANAIDCTWTEGTLRTAQVRPGVIRHPGTGQRAWFNHAAFWSEWTLEEEIREVLIEEFGHDGLPFATAYGDGSELRADDVAQINAAYETATRRRPWRQGDLLLVDNLLSSHGRDAFTGRRDIVVAMGEQVALADCATVPAVTAR